jgi:hypothetical protein
MSHVTHVSNIRRNWLVVKSFYAAQTLAGANDFVNVDEMPKKVGITFYQLLENEARRRRGPD